MIPGHRFPTPPVPVPVYPRILLTRREVPIPFLRGILLRSGVGRGVSIFAGASKSKAAKDVERGFVSVISLLISPTAPLCAVSAVCREANASGVNDLLNASDSNCFVGSCPSSPFTNGRGDESDLLNSPR